MTLWTLIRRGLIHYWRTNLAVAFGSAVGVAVLVGSLIVGDSVRGSLRDLALERLGGISHTITSPSFFREQLATDFVSRGEFPRLFGLSSPGIILNATARHADSQMAVPGVTVWAMKEVFWRVTSASAIALPRGRTVLLNQNLAEDIGARTGDALLVTVGQRGAASASGLFGHRAMSQTTLTRRVIVGGILPDAGLGRFSLRSDQPRPRNIYVSLPWLQRQLDRQEQSNVVLILPLFPARFPTREAMRSALAEAATLADYRLHLSLSEPTGDLVLGSDEVVVTERVASAAQAVSQRMGLRAATVSAYLANSLAVFGREDGAEGVPYSTVVGVDPRQLMLPMLDGAEPPPLTEGDILLNEWAADDLNAEVGDRIAMDCYAPNKRGELHTEFRSFMLRGIVAMRGVALDRHLVPSLRGLTDAEAIGTWEPPFPIDMARIRPRDEAYWDEYRTAPKAFVSLVVAHRLWTRTRASARDWVTSIRLTGGGVDGFESALLSELTPQEFGITVRPVREEALAAAKGSTDFGVLFLSMSMFLMAASAGLVMLLFRLTVERRANQGGVMLATGLSPRALTGELMCEGAIVATAGSVIGALLGVGYARLIIHALATWWRGAAGRVAFSLHVSPLSVLIGSVAGLLVAVIAMWWATRILRRRSAVALLAGWRPSAVRVAGRRRAVRIGALLLIASFMLALVSIASGHGIQPWVFFLTGSLLLVAILVLFTGLFQQAKTSAGRTLLSMRRLAWRGAARNRLRSVLTAGLMACASFIVVAVAANRQDLSRLDTRRTDSGAGGFNLSARSDLPIWVDLGSEHGREQFGLGDTARAALKECVIVSLRSTEGDDVSCLNVQRPTTPRVLGVPREIIARGGFAFTVPSGNILESSWESLEQKSSDGTVPAFADAASAQWIMHAGVGDVIEVPGIDGNTVKLKLVGLLGSSVFAGELLVSEPHFVKHFGADSGYRRFLIRTPEDQEESVVMALRNDLGPLGFDVVRTADLLASYAQVQNTYLATFQTLGGLGLLLGTFGLVTVLLRSVAERRGEFAMMLALGFRRAQIAGIMFLENAFLLAAGLAAGTVSALVAVAPHLISVQADVRWLSLCGTLVACLAVGLLSCLIAAFSSVRRGLLAALRSE